MKKCPFCAEQIQDEAIVCRFCGRNLQAVPPPLQVQLVAPKRKTSLVTWGCLALIIFLVLSALVGTCSEYWTSNSPPRDSAPRPSREQQAQLLRVVGSQGQVDFVVGRPVALNNPKLLEAAARELCDSTRRDWCQIMIWPSTDVAARRLPLSDAALQSQIAQYSRNRATGYDCFYEMRDGRMLEDTRSSGCR